METLEIRDAEIIHCETEQREKILTQFACNDKVESSDKTLILSENNIVSMQCKNPLWVWISH